MDTRTSREICKREKAVGDRERERKEKQRDSR